jgi:hypothetical protein
MLAEKIPNFAEKAGKRMRSLNSAIEKVEGLNQAYHIGPAYFLKLQDYRGDFNQLWLYHIEPLLNEYLRGMPNDDKKNAMNDLRKSYELSPLPENENDNNGL